MRYLRILLVFSLLVTSVAAAELVPIQPTVINKVALCLNGVWYSIDAISLVKVGDVTIITLGTAPTPTPTPVPVPVPVPPGPTTPFRDAVKAALATVTDKSKAEELAEIYESVAAEAAGTPASWTVKNLVAEVKIRTSTTFTINDLAAWRSFWTPLATAFTTLNLEDADVDKAIVAFRDVAAVLRGE